MKTLAFYSIGAILLGNIRNLYVKRKERHMGSKIVKETLSHVLMAPVNLFFDVTPVGKILKIFQEEINIFRNHLFDPLKHILNMMSHIVIVAGLMFSIGFSETLIGFAIIGLVLSKIVPFFTDADGQLHKVSSSLWGPIHSYFYECMRGTTIIRAFGEENHIMKKQHEMMDQTTL